MMMIINFILLCSWISRKMNKHVNKLNKEANDARKMVEDVESDSEDSDHDQSRKTMEKPTEEQVEKLEEKLEAAQADQKNLFLIIFQVRNRGIIYLVRSALGLFWETRGSRFLFVFLDTFFYGRRFCVFSPSLINIQAKIKI